MGIKINGVSLHLFFRLWIWIWITGSFIVGRENFTLPQSKNGTKKIHNNFSKIFLAYDKWRQKWVKKLALNFHFVFWFKNDQPWKFHFSKWDGKK